MKEHDILDALEHIAPTKLNYQEWIDVGMALKHEGYSASHWDSWSSADSRYRNGECFRKWESFHGSSLPVTGGTIVQMAIDQGWQPATGHEFEWDDTIEKDELVIIDKNWIESKEVTEPAKWDPTGELIKYLEILFESAENVGYVTESWVKDGRHLPSSGNWDRTAGQLIQQLSQNSGDIGAVMGDCSPEAGAWIRFNPVDGKGCKNDNVTDYRYALVESDDMEIDKQNAIIRELELPVACLVHSGGKSIHAIVRVEAADYNEYRKRVDYLYNVCQKNGMKIDTQNKNPSRLSRMPGVCRNGHKQFLIDTNIGKKSWGEWVEWVESVNDDLPEPEALEDIWDDLPELSPPLIKDVLRQGHKMLIAGPSKAGKSFALIELCCAVAEGRKWLSWACTKGRILYVNLELDRASCLHRFKDVYQSLGWQPNNLKNIDIWNLRGKAIPMDKLAPKLIRRAAKKNYIAIVIDPIYKVITGDENSADQMARFCNQFDTVCTELGCSVIYCHHHSKGNQGGKRSMDRASGSGVFARDPDAMLDLIELEPTEAIIKQEENKASCNACIQHLNALFDDWDDDVSQDEMLSISQMLAYCKKKLSGNQYSELLAAVEAAKKAVENMTAWRIEGTLREFPKFRPVNAWFDYPIHRVDNTGALQEVEPEDVKPGWQKNGKKDTEGQKEDNLKERRQTLEMAYEASTINGEVTISDIEKYTNLSKNTIKNYIKQHEEFYYEGGVVHRKVGVKVSTDTD